MKHWKLAALAAALSSSAFAQAPMHKHGMMDPPTQPVTAVPKYESAFENYRAHADEKIRPWRESNDEAASLGGHLGQWRGQIPDNLPGGAKPMAPGMDHRHMHGKGGQK